MAFDFLDVLTAALPDLVSAGAGAGADFLTSAAAEPSNYVEAIPDLAEAAAPAAESVATATPGLLNLAGDLGPSAANQATFADRAFQPIQTVAPGAGAAAPDQPSDFYQSPQSPNPNELVGTPGVGVSGTSGVNSYEQPSEQTGAPGSFSAGPGKPPTAWESIQNIPGKWWQGVESSPERLGNQLAESPFKTLGTAALLGGGLASAFAPRQTPQAPSFNFGASSAPKTSAFDTAPKAGPARSPIIGNRGGFGVNASTGVRRPGGMAV